jgi:hypothetical protein
MVSDSILLLKPFGDALNERRRRRSRSTWNMIQREIILLQLQIIDQWILLKQQSRYKYLFIYLAYILPMYAVDNPQNYIFK